MKENFHLALLALGVICEAPPAARCRPLPPQD
jgi:hypothetical protein